MEAYICLVLNGGRLRAFGIECLDDAVAVEQATTILRSQPSNQSVEIWRHGRCVGSVENNGSDMHGDAYPNSR
jgi:hypothetical protein